MGNFGGGVEAAVSADVIFNLLLSALALVEFLGVGIVPPGEPYFGGRAVVGRVWVRARWRREDWKWEG